MRIYSFVIVIIVLSILTISPAQAGKTVTLGYIGAPLSYTSLAVLKVAYAKIGYTVETIEGPGARLLIDSNSGLTDGEVHRVKSVGDNYPNLIRIDPPVNTLEGVLISCAGRNDIKNVEDLAKFRVVVRIGNKYAEKLVEGFPYVTKTPDDKKMVHLLQERRVDFILSDRPWAMSQQHMPGQGCLKIHEPPLVVIPLYHYIHVRNADIADELSEVLRQMNESGETAQIIHRAATQYVQQ